MSFESSRSFPIVLSRDEEWTKLRDSISADDLEPLTQRAKELLTVPPPTVTAKPADFVAPSGDPHDYNSLGKYWWPDPDSPTGLPYIRRDGRVNPEVEKFDRPRFGLLTSGCSTLIVHGWLTGNAASFQTAALWLRTWFLDPATRMNPHLEYAQHIPGRCNGRGIGLIETEDCAFLLDLMPLLAASGEWPESEQTGLRDWFAQYLDWFRTSSHGMAEEREHNNHGSWFDTQVMAFARFCGRDDLVVEQWESWTRARILAHISIDGRQPHEESRTLSLGYSVFNLTALVGAASAAFSADPDLIDPESEEMTRLVRAHVYLSPFLRGEKPWPLEQIKPVADHFCGWITHQMRRMLPDQMASAAPLVNPSDRPAWNDLAPLEGVVAQ